MFVFESLSDHVLMAIVNYGTCVEIQDLLGMVDVGTKSDGVSW